MHRSEECRSRTKLILFLGTPHRGSSYAEWGKIIANLTRLVFRDSNKTVVKTLQVNAEVLDNIHDEFISVVFQYGIKIHSFQESRGILGMKGLQNKVSRRHYSSLSKLFNANRILGCQRLLVETWVAKGIRDSGDH
jgi:hypothetical protein